MSTALAYKASPVFPKEFLEKLTQKSSESLQSSESLPQRIDIIIERHGRTPHNENGWISGGAANPELLPKGEEGAKKANAIFEALRKVLTPNGDPLTSDTSPVYSTDRLRAVMTAQFFTGRGDDYAPIIDKRLLERNLGDWDIVLTERLQREFKKIDRYETLGGQVKDFLMNCLSE